MEDAAHSNKRCTTQPCSVHNLLPWWWFGLGWISAIYLQFLPSLSPPYPLLCHLKPGIVKRVLTNTGCFLQTFERAWAHAWETKLCANPHTLLPVNIMESMQTCMGSMKNQMHEDIPNPALLVWRSLTRTCRGLCVSCRPVRARCCARCWMPSGLAPSPACMDALETWAP